MGVLKELMLKDYVTLLGTMFGTLTIIFSIFGVVSPEPDLIPLAALMWVGAMSCDLLDGLVARKLNQSNEIGKEIDSLSDAVSFVAAPSVLILCASLDGEFPVFLLPPEAVMIGIFVLVFFGITRLAWYNVANVGEGYTGLTTPLSAGVLVIFYLAHHYFLALETVIPPYFQALSSISFFLSNTLTITIIMIVLGILNIAPFLRYGKNVQKRRGIWKYIIIALGVLIVIAIVLGRGLKGLDIATIVSHAMASFFVLVIVSYIVYGVINYISMRRRGELNSQ